MEAGSRMRIRAARADDEELIASLDAAAWSPESGFPSVLERTSAGFFSEDAPPDAHLVAEIEGRVAGYIRLARASRLPENSHVLVIAGLAVAPDARRAGIGAALLAAAEDFARARGARKLSLHVLGTNEPAMRLYQRSGFRAEGALREEFRINGRYVDDVIMAKPLEPRPDA